MSLNVLRKRKQQTDTEISYEQTQQNLKQFDTLYNQEIKKNGINQNEKYFSTFLGCFLIILALNYIFFKYTFYLSIFYTFIGIIGFFVFIIFASFVLTILVNFESLVFFGVLSCILTSIVILIFPSLLY